MLTDKALRALKPTDKPYKRADAKRPLLHRTAGRCYLVALPPRRIEPLLNSDFSEMTPDISPDGRWLAYASNESGSVEVYVRPFPDVDRARWQISRQGGSRPQWSRDGAEIFYITPDRQLMAAQVTLSPNFAVGAVMSLFDATPYASRVFGTGARAHDLSLDGQKLLMYRDEHRGGRFRSSAHRGSAELVRRAEAVGANRMSQCPRRTARQGTPSRDC